MENEWLYRVYWNHAAAHIRPFIIFFIFLFSNFQALKFFVTLWGLEGWNLLHTWKMGGCIVYTKIMLLLLFVLLFFYFSFCPILKQKILSHFSQELWGLEDWNLVRTWTVGRCIVYTEIRLLLHSHPFISSFFFLSNFQTLKFFITLFSGTVRPRRLKLGTHMDSGQMCHVYRNQAAAAYLSFYFFIFLSLNFSSHFSQELWGLEGWNLVLTWTVGRCIVYTGIRLLLFIHSFISSFFLLSILFFFCFSNF